MKNRQHVSMVEQAYADDPESLVKPATEFEDGSAAFACTAFDYDGFVWLTNGHFCLRSAPVEKLPRTGKMPCPPQFVAMLGEVPPRSFVPREVPTNGAVIIGKAQVQTIYFNACQVGRSAKSVTWRSSTDRSPVFGLDSGTVFCVIMPCPPKVQS